MMHHDLIFCHNFNVTPICLVSIEKFKKENFHTVLCTVVLGNQEIKPQSYYHTKTFLIINYEFILFIVGQMNK
ncbi:hypothetical protein T4B_8450 [Trichinella pseudospiralis]|uniref:Uncharacterized protein n=1 Tax=Trichinella pseudospiralis TaxID=6337 RepID=A0A0V1INF3_TRIPS|nr:hypothetical protein T4A_537 [Trichinella pseudospiralis]KRZ24336.1 hypothetical protein T4B_8450 [Trichinella pseudospiralis]